MRVERTISGGQSPRYVKKGMEFQRKCCDCGKSITNYRCEDCWKKLRDMDSSDYGIIEENSVTLDANFFKN